MYLRDLHIPTTKEDPSDVAIISHKLMIKAGLMRQISYGLYTLLPLGVRVLQKISNIIRKNINEIGGSEVIFPVIQNNELWIKSGRSDGYCGKETLRMQDRNGTDMLFSPTAEEVAHEIFSMDVKSYKQLPVSLYQINTKFRDEIRPRFGVMRCREFVMFDAYSFDYNENLAIKTYDKYFLAYLKIFKEIGLKAIPMKANSGEIGGDLSHEFHILAENGESGVYFDKKFDEIIENIEDFDVNSMKNIYAKTDEEHNEKNYPIPKENLEYKRGIEVGHIFYYGNKYSKTMDIKIQNNESKMVHPVGGCYGIGVTRLIAAAIEVNNDTNGIIWPENIAPFTIILINLATNNEKITAKCNELYKFLRENNIEVLFDNTENSIGNKMKFADLIGISLQIILGAKSFENSEFEVKFRKDNKKIAVKFHDIKSFVTKLSKVN